MNGQPCFLARYSLSIARCPLALGGINLALSRSVIKFDPLQSAMTITRTWQREAAPPL